MYFLNNNYFKIENKWWNVYYVIKQTVCQYGENNEYKIKLIKLRNYLIIQKWQYLLFILFTILLLETPIVALESHFVLPFGF